MLEPALGSSTKDPTKSATKFHNVNCLKINHTSTKALNLLSSFDIM